MPLLPDPPTRPPDLVAEASSDGVRIALYGLLAALFGVVLTAVGVVGPCFLLFGPLLALLGIVVIPLGLWQAIDPTSHVALAPLGATSAARKAEARRIAAEVPAAGTVHVRLSSGVTLCVTRGWLVAYGGTLIVARREDLLHAWGVTTVRTRYGFETGRSHKVALRTRHHKYELDVGANEEPDVLGCVAMANPSAILGYRPEVESLPVARLAALVVDRAPESAPTDRLPDAPRGGAGLSDLAAPKASPRPDVARERSPAPARAVRPATSRGSSLGPIVALLAGLSVMIGLPTVFLAAPFLGCSGLLGLGLWLESRIADIAPACAEQPVPTADGGPLDPSAPSIVVRWKAGRWTPGVAQLHRRVPEADTTEEAKLAVCVGEPQRVVIGACGLRERVRYTAPVRIVRAVTGETLLAIDVDGSEPASCSTAAPSGADIIGGEIGADELAPLIRRVLASAPEAEPGASPPRP